MLPIQFHQCNCSYNLPYAFCEQVGKEIRDISDEIPFDIPECWKWCRLSDLAIKEIKRGKSPVYSDSGSVLVFAQKCNVKTGGINISLAKYLADSAISKYPQEEYMQDDDIIVNSTGTGTLGRIGQYSSKCNPDNLPLVPDSHVTIVRVDNDISKYIYYILKWYQPFLEESGEGSTKQKELKADRIKELLIPIPPFAEQRRIVSKIGELLPHIEKYGAAETKLNVLNSTFPEALKKSILQEAVQGKLVPQNPDDEPASVLLERIRAEKQALIKAGKIKKDKHESVIVTRDKIPYEIIDGKERCIADEVPFELPESWCWCRLSDIVGFIGGFAYNSSDFIQKSNNQVLRLGNVKNDELKLSAKPVFISDELANNTAGFRCKVNDILLTMTGTRLKRDYFFTVRMLSETPPLFINQRVGCLRAFDSNMAHWLTWILKSEAALSQVFQHETGTANQGNLGAENILKTMIPLPPIAEQKRIVAKIEELMPIISTISK